MEGLRVSVDLLDFFRTGRFDCLRIGKSQEWILHNFPHPDDASGRLDAGRTIWRYGNLELHFEQHSLWMIFSDYVASLDGGASIALDPWQLAEPAGRTLSAVMRALTREKIDFAKHTNRIAQVELQLASGVTLTFDDVDPDREPTLDANELPLVAFALR